MANFTILMIMYILLFNNTQVLINLISLRLFDMFINEVPVNVLLP